jgi:hypothetical protein
VSNRGTWLPGGYDTEETAREAATLGDDKLAELNDRIFSIHGENRRITAADLR